MLASHLPLPVPVALANGVPGAGYPFDWSVYQWLEGQTVSVAPPADLIGFAVDLADFLIALREVDTAGGPPPGLHNWFRGGPLKTLRRPHPSGTCRAGRSSGRPCRYRAVGGGSHSALGRRPPVVPR